MDYYPFGATLRSSFTSGTSVDSRKHQYQGKERMIEMSTSSLPEDNNGVDDFGGRWFDASIVRSYNVDTAREKFLTMSPYASMGNNPLIYVDPSGDTIFVSESLAKTKEFQKWKESEAGKQFYAAFDVGGEWSDINVNFDLAKTFTGSDVDGNFDYGINIGMVGGNTQLLEDGKPVEALNNNLNNKSIEPKKDSKYSFNVTLNPFSRNYNSSDKNGFTNVDQNGKVGYNTTTHETDHVIFMTKNIKEGKSINSNQDRGYPQLQNQGGKMYNDLPKKKKQ